MVSLVRLLYASSQATVRKNRTNSDYFHLYRSTELLFAIAMEPQSIALQSQTDICAIIRNSVKLKVDLHADDLLLVLSDLSRSIPSALSVLDAFSKISGYKLNLGESEVFAVNREANEYLLVSPTI